MNLALLYTVFAVISTAMNIGSQEITTRVYGGLLHIPISVFIGTAVGLVVKYLLDKNWIFRFRTVGAKHDASTFALYTIMGLVTTVVFWGFEFGFNYIFETKDARYAGAVIGLAIGYVIKYHLDKRFVFSEGRAK
jgi:putative flippase GtrA